jgi:hypothetical protein
MGTICLCLLKTLIFSQTKEEEVEVVQEDGLSTHVRNFPPSPLNRNFQASQVPRLNSPRLFLGLNRNEIIKSLNM